MKIFSSNRKILSFLTIVSLFFAVSMISLSIYLYFKNSSTSFFIVISIGIPGAIVFLMFFTINIIYFLFNRKKQGNFLCSLPILINIISIIILILFDYIFPSPILISHNDVKISKRFFSPNNNYIALTYYIDSRPLGISQNYTSVLHIQDTTKNLNKFLIPNKFKPIGWDSTNSFKVSKNVIPDIRKKKLNFKPDSIYIKGIKVKIFKEDFINKDWTGYINKYIQKREISPDSSKELIAYRYPKSPIHISIISVGDTIPKYGNFYIGEPNQDFVYNAEWVDNNKINLYSNSNLYKYVNNFLVKNNFKIDVEVLIDEGFKDKRKWITISY